MNKIIARRSTAVAAGAFVLCLAGSPTLANEASEREAQMEQRLRELEAQVERLTAGTTAGASSELASRVAELERAVAAGETGLSAYWKQGLRADAAAGDFKFKIGGRTQVDFMRGDVDNAIERHMGSTLDPVEPDEPFENGVYFRRARLYIAGQIYENVGFKAEYDFAGGDADFADVFITLDHPCVGLFTVGHHYEPIGLENLTSDNYVTFMERSFVSDLLPERNTGMSLRNSIDGNWGWAVGSFRESDSAGDDKGNTGQGEWNHTGRIAGVVWEEPDRNHLVHIGLGATFRHPADETVTFHTKGAQRLSKGYFSSVTLTDASPAGWIYNLEAAYVNGPFFFQSEFARAEFDATGPFVSGGDAEVQAWHAEAGYFLTGESRTYDRKNNVFGRTGPKKNYGKDGGTGAVQVALRFATWSPTGAAGSAPDIEQWTAGIAWYLNPNTRVLLNLTKGHADDLGDYDLLGMRFQVDF